MAAPSVTYSFTNGTAADATEVNQNFTDIINGITDGTKDITVNLLQANGAATFNGNVTLGNATGDAITFTGRVSSDIDPTNAATNTLGDATQTWRALYLDNTATDGGAVYFDGGSTKFLKANAAGTDLQMGGFTYFDLQAGASIKTFGRYLEAKSANYTITDTDGVSIIAMTTGASDRTVTLPTASDNTGRIIDVKKVDSGVGKCTVAGTIDGETTGKNLVSQYDSIQVLSDGSVWQIIGFNLVPVRQFAAYNATSGSHGSTSNKIPYLNTNISNSGSGLFTTTQTSALGTFITLSKKCWLFVSYIGGSSAGGSNIGISKNASSVTTAIQSLAASERVAYTTTPAANGADHVSYAGVGAANDIFRPHTEGTALIATASRNTFWIEAMSIELESA